MITKTSITNRNYAITKDLWNILNDIYGWQAWEIQIQIKTQNSYIVGRIEHTSFQKFPQNILWFLFQCNLSTGELKKYQTKMK